MFNPSNPPAWVSGGSTNDGSIRKFHRAVMQLRKENKEITEQSVKDLYIKFGGLVIGEPEEAVEETPIKRSRK